MKKILKTPAFDFFNTIIITKLPVSMLFFIWGFMFVFSLRKIQNLYTFDSFNWRYIHWLFNYDFGFVKRGLVGQTLSFFKISNDYLTVSLIALAVFLIFLGVFIFLASRQIIKNKKSEGAWLFFYVMTLHSATLQHAFLDLLRFDYINYLWFFLYLWIINYIGRIAAYIALYVIMSLMLLIHEAAFFMFFPLMLACLMFRLNQVFSLKKEWPYMFFIGVVLVFQCYIISSKAVLSMDKWPDFMRRISNNVVGISDFDLKDGAMVIFRPLADNVSYAASHVEALHNFIFHVVFFLINAPFFYILFHIFLEQCKATRLGSQEAFYRVLGLLACFSPLILYPIGYDYFRWWSLSLTNLFIMLTLMARSTMFAAVLQKIFERHRILVLWGIVVPSLWYGPVRVIASYDAAFEPLLLLRYFLATITNQPAF